MTIHQKLSGLACLISFTICAVYPTSIAAIFAIVFSISLYAFSIFIHEKSGDEIKSLAKRIDDLESKISSLTFAKAMGR